MKIVIISILFIQLYLNNFLESFSSYLNSLDTDALERVISDNKDILSSDDIIKAKKLLINKRNVLEKLALQLTASVKSIKIKPVIKWAQNKSQVFLYIKLAHRYDAPGCIDIKEKNIKVTDDNKLLFNVKCI